jgi:hypothetical protein
MGLLTLALILLAPHVHSASYSFRVYSQGTYWDFGTPKQISQKDRSELSGYLKDRDEEFSEWNELSKLRLIERQGYTKPFVVAERLLFMFDFISNLDPQLKPLFDPTIEKHRRGLSHKTGTWKDLQSLGNQKYVFLKDPGALTFSGALKGFETAELGLSLEKMGFEDYTVNAGGGNLLTLQNEIYFIQSLSGQMQTQGKTSLSHIKDPRDAFRPLKFRFSKIECVLQKTSDKDLLRLATLADVLSTVTLFEDKIFIPNGCRLERIPIWHK